MKIKKMSYVLGNFIKSIISELLHPGFLFSFFNFKISELCNSEVLLSLMHLLHPTDLSFGSNWVQKTKPSIYEISRMLFSNMDFNFVFFANFNIFHLEIEDAFELIWVKLQNGQFGLQISILGI